MSEVLDVLRKARDMVSRENGWTREWQVYGAHCALGAVKVVSGVKAQPLCFDKERSHRVYVTGFEAEPEVVEHAGRLLSECIDGPALDRKGAWYGVTKYNDSHDQECVVALFDAAIEKQEKETK